MKRIGGITFMVIVPLIAGLAFLVASLASFTYIDTRSVAVESARNAALLVFDELGAKIASMSEAINRKAAAFAKYESLESQWILYSESVESRRLYGYLDRVLAESPNISSVGLLLDPRLLGRSLDEVTHAPFAVRSGDSSIIVDIGGSDANYLSTDAYLAVRSADRPVWVRSPFAESEGGKDVAYAYPFKSGAIVFDMSYPFIESLAAKIDVPYRGILNISSASGKKIFSSDKNGRTAESRTFMVRFTVPETGWRLEIAYPKHLMESRARDAALTMLAMGAVASLFIVVVMTLITSSLSKSVNRLRESVELMSGGDIDTPTQKMNSPVEVAALYDILESSRIEIARRVAEKERNLRERESVRREQQTVRDVQRAYLPPSIASDDTRYAIAARLLPAKKQRGVFYDAIPTSRATVYIAVGEIVTGDVDSLLTLFRVLSYLRALLWDGPKPAHVMSRVNEIVESEFGAENPMSMLLLEFHPASGICVISGADCAAVIVVRDGEALTIDMPRTEKLPSEEPAFTNTIFNMSRGDSLLLYTSRVASDIEKLSEYAVEAVADAPTAEEVLDSICKMIDETCPEDDIGEDSAILLLKYE